MEQLYYELKPFIFYAVGFACGHLDHPIKWISVMMFILASIMIIKWRYSARTHFNG